MVAEFDRPEEDHRLQLGSPLRNEAEGQCQTTSCGVRPEAVGVQGCEKELNIETGVEEDIPAQYDYGIQRILASWEEMVGRTALDRKGELRERFYMITWPSNEDPVKASRTSQ